MMDRHGPDHADAAGQARPRKLVRVVLAVVGLFLIVLFAGLGTWQVQRLQWKLALIERVNSRVSAPPVAAPTSAVSREADEYRHLRLDGHFLYDYTTPVQAVSELGAGYWLITPLCTPSGTIVLVNRGFIPAADARGRYRAREASGNVCLPAGPVHPQLSPLHALTGLLRISEPGGGFLRENDPVGNRWFSRDVAAIAAARGLNNVAPYFVDAARGQDPAGAPDKPVGGLTVISFQNNHLVYAITWYALALMVLGAWWYVARSGRTEETGKARTDGSKA
ncbi:MAG: hypothetical protein JWQ80_3176 [Massilia sp.]|nr:hypothetical protein [Massilia sp.]